MQVPEKIQAAMDRLPSGPWEVWTSCSFRRISGPDGGDGDVLSGTVQRSDGHPDLSMTAEQLTDLCDVVNWARSLRHNEEATDGRE